MAWLLDGPMAGAEEVPPRAGWGGWRLTDGVAHRGAGRPCRLGAPEAGEAGLAALGRLRQAKQAAGEAACAAAGTGAAARVTRSGSRPRCERREGGT